MIEHTLNFVKYPAVPYLREGSPHSVCTKWMQLYTDVASMQRSCQECTGHLKTTATAAIYLLNPRQKEQAGLSHTIMLVSLSKSYAAASRNPDKLLPFCSIILPTKCACSTCTGCIVHTCNSSIKTETLRDPQPQIWPRYHIRILFRSPSSGGRCLINIMCKIGI